MMVFANRLDVKLIFYILRKVDILLFPIILKLLLLHYFSFSFILELLDGLKLLFGVDMAV